MNWRSYLRAVLVTSLITLIVDVFLNAVVFRDVYRAAAPYLLPASDLNARLAVGWGALLVIVAAFGFLFVRGPWRGIRGGLEFAGVFAVSNAAGIAGFASLLPWPARLLFVVGLQQVCNSVVLGLVFGAFHPPTPAAESRSAVGAAPAAGGEA